MPGIVQDPQLMMEQLGRPLRGAVDLPLAARRANGSEALRLVAFCRAMQRKKLDERVALCSQKGCLGRFGAAGRKTAWVHDQKLHVVRPLRFVNYYPGRYPLESNRRSRSRLQFVTARYREARSCRRKRGCLR